MAILRTTVTEVPIGPLPFRIGLVSDTHGLMRPEALAALAGCHHILHAGDVGSPAILEALATLAPVSAVRGNNDREAWADDLPQAALVGFGALRIYLLHDLAELDLEPGQTGIAAVVTGHSHRPNCEQRDGVLYLNPGSAGPRRFSLPVSVARLVLVSDRPPQFELRQLEV